MLFRFDFSSPGRLEDFFAFFRGSERKKVIPMFLCFFLHLPNYLLYSCQIFLPLISVPTGFNDWGLVTRWAQLMITINYYLPSKSKDQSSMRAELSVVIGNRGCGCNLWHTQSTLKLGYHPDWASEYGIGRNIGKSVGSTLGNTYNLPNIQKVEGSS